MKCFERDIFYFQDDDLFSPIRGKIDYIKIILLSARSLLLNIEAVNGPPSHAKLKLIIDKMSRLFFYKENKFYTISFPFFVSGENNIVNEIRSHSGKLIDYKSISIMLSIIGREEFRHNPSVIDCYIEPMSEDADGLFILEEILLFEPGYLRYDKDAIRANGMIHPLNHLDFNFTEYCTYKFGLNQDINEQVFEDLLNINTNCAFLS